MTEEYEAEKMYYIIATVVLAIGSLVFAYLKAKYIYGGDMRCLIAECRILTVGFDKNGEVDFGINCSVEDLTYKKYKDIREMTIVAIGHMENIWGRKKEPLCLTDKLTKEI